MTCYCLACVCRVDDWFLMSSVWPTVGLCALYYYIIRVGGPRFMEDRDPFDCQRIIIFYNLFQTLFSVWIFHKATRFWFTGTHIGLISLLYVESTQHLI